MLIKKNYGEKTFVVTCNNFLLVTFLVFSSQVIFIIGNIASMTSKKKRDHICVHFTGKNYLVWELQFKMHVKENKLWSHLNDVSKASIEKTALEEWEYKDVQVITWILSSIDSQMINNLCSFSTAQEMWDYLKRI